MKNKQQKFHALLMKVMKSEEISDSDLENLTNEQLERIYAISAWIQSRSHGQKGPKNA